MKHTIRTGLLAVAVFGMIACGKGGNQSGAQEELGTMESTNTTAAPRQAEQPGLTPVDVPGVETPPATQNPDGTTTPSTGITGVAIGFQPVNDTPVATVMPHPGHELLITDIAPTPAPAPAAAFTKEWFVSGSTGNDNGTGDEAQPFKTIARGVQAVGPGEVLRVQSGDYNEALVLAGKDGTETAKITIQGEGAPRITGNGDIAVKFKAKHWVMDGFKIDLQNAPKFAVTFEGNNQGSTLANSEVMNGTAGAGVNVHTNSNGAIIENNHIHHFSRGNDDSHGVVVQTTTTNTVVRNNDIHDISGDSVQCLGPEGYNSNAPANGLLIEDNHFYAAQENGVDIKTCHNVTIKNNRMHNFRPASAGQGAKGDAIVIHLSAKNVTVEGNDLYDAGKGIALGGNREGPPPSGIVIRRNTIHDIKKDSVMEGSGIRVENSDGAIIVNNVFWNLQGPGVVLGHGTGGATQNLTLKNNIIGGTGLSLKVGTQAPGLKSDGNLFAAGAQFSMGGTAQSFTEWQQGGQDATSTTGDPGFAGDTFVAGPAALDKGQNVGLPFCGAAPDVGSVEAGC